MSFNEKMTAISDAFRKQYGTTDKYGLDDMPALIDGLEVTNLLDPGQAFDSDTDWGADGDKQLTGITVDKLNTVLGRNLTFSCDVEWTGFKALSGSNNRIGFEYAPHFENGKAMWCGAWCYPTTENGKQHVSETFALDDSKVTSCEEGFAYDQINQDAHVKITNIKVVVNPVGGVVPTNLFDGYLGFEIAFIKRQGNLYSFDAPHYGQQYASLIFSNDKTDLSSCNQLRLSFKARGNGSVWTYLFGNNYNGTYVDNGKEWHLTDTWQDFSQDFSRESIPLSALFAFRTMEHNSGEVTDLKLIKLE